MTERKMEMGRSEDFEFNLGDKLRDKITKFEGIVISRSQWLTNCNTYGLKSEKLHKGQIVDTQWIDEMRLEVVEADVHSESRDTGGPTESIAPTNRM